MIDPRGRLIYVGKAKCLRPRLLSYFRAASRDEKAGRIVEAARAVVWEYCGNEFAALLRELELIRRWKPSYNVLGQPGRRRGAYLCLGKKPAPYLFASAEPSNEHVACFGPLPGFAFVAEAARKLNDLFRLRDCPQSQTMHFADQRRLFSEDRPAGCLRYELGTCSGPCAEYVTRSSYSAQTREVRRFLEGKNDSVLDRLSREMMTAAEALSYERAAALRDRIEFVRRVSSRLAWLQQAREEYSFVYQAADEDGRPLWYLIRQGQVRGVCHRPTESAARSVARQMLDQVYRPEPATATVPLDRLDGVLLVAAWFRKRPEERRNCLSPAVALDLCRPMASLEHVAS